MVIKFNSKKASSGFAPIPAGKYEAFVEGGAFKTASTGSPMINWKFKIRNDVEGQEYGGRVLFNNLVFTEATEGMVHGFLKAIGTPEDMEFPDYKDIIAYATGKAILLNVKIEQYRGEDVNRISWVEESKVGGGRVDDPFATTVPTPTQAPADPFAGTTTAAPVQDPFASSKPIEISEDDLPF